MNLKPLKPKNQGIALLSALLIVVFIATTISVWIIQTKQYLYREQLVTTTLQTWQLEQAANLWAVHVLEQNTKFKKANPILAHSDGREFTIPKLWRIQANLIDAQSFFNINNLQEASMQISFVLLLQNVLKNTPESQIKQILNATLAWINPDISVADSQSFTQFYQQSQPPYQASGQLMINISEWKKVAGVTPEIYRALYPFLTALPETTPINLNTSNTVLLKILKPGLSNEDIQKLVFARGSDGFESDDELYQILQQLKLPVEKTTVNSQYFYLDIKITAPNGHRVFLRNLFYRPLNRQNKILVNLIQRAQLR
jgi:general secretion pathway protein K